MKRTTISAVIVLVTIFVTSCTTLNRTMREPNVRVEFYKNDFIFSNQVIGEARTVRILRIDWARLFGSKEGDVKGNLPLVNLANIPVIGTVMVDRTANYALYDMMKKNPGYDVVFYPQYEIMVAKPVLGLGFISQITTAKATARLGIINVGNQTIRETDVTTPFVGEPIRSMDKTDLEPQKKLETPSNTINQLSTKQYQSYISDSIKAVEAENKRLERQKATYERFIAEYKLGDELILVGRNGQEFVGKIEEILADIVVVKNISTGELYNVKIKDVPTTSK